MAAILERLAQDVEKAHPDFAVSLRKQAQQARELGVRENFSIVETEKPNTEILMLEHATKEYQTKPNAEYLTRFFQAFWAQKGKLVGKEFVVLEFSGTAKELRKMREAEKMPIFVPAEVTYADLGKMFPDMGYGWATEEENNIVDTNNDSGWLLVDGSVNAPHRDTTREELIGILEQEGEDSMSLKQYIVASQISKLLTGKYFDQSLTWSMLSSCEDGRVLGATFHSDGSLAVGSNRENQQSPNRHIGGRGEKRIEAA